MKEVYFKNGVPYIKGRTQNYRAMSSECVYCGVKFYTYYRDSEKRPGHGNYCSQECLRKAQSKMWGARRRNKRCVICKKEFQLQPSEYSRRSTCGNIVCFTERASQLGKKGAALRKAREIREGL